MTHPTNNSHLCDAFQGSNSQPAISPLCYDISSLLPLVTRIARRYTLPPKCAITHDDLIQEACLALLEANGMSLAGESEGLLLPNDRDAYATSRDAYAIARKAMQRVIARYISPVSHTIEDTLPAPNEPNFTERQMRDDLLDSALAYIGTLDSQLAAAAITYANYRKKKQRFLHKMRRQVSQNSDSSV